MDSQQAVFRLLEDDSLKRIALVASQFNIFDAVGMANQEIRHSYFFAFLLNPNESHGLGSAFLSGFLSSVFDENIPDSIAFDSWKADQIKVDREWNFIDILVRVPQERIAIVIENKIWTGEHSDQLTRYLEVAQSHHVGWRIIPVYLTPGGSSPSNNRYKAVRYSTIVELIEDLLDCPQFADMNPDTRVLLRHYTQLIRKNMVGGSDLEALCQKVYLEHREAIDLINKYRPDTQADLRQFIEELVGETDGLIPLTPIKKPTESNHKKFCAFIPSVWDELVPHSATGLDNWTTRICNFVIVNLPSEVHILLQLRPGSERDRQVFYTIAESIGWVSGNRMTKYPELRRWNLITPSDYRTTTPEALRDILRTMWNDFVVDELPSVTELFRKQLTNDQALEPQ